MMRTLKYMAVLAAAALMAAACTRDRTEDEPIPVGPPSSDMPICWDVTAATDYTRAMIGEVPPATEQNPDPLAKRPESPYDPNFYTTLTEVCELPADDPYMENGYAVGLFGDYSYEDGGKTVYEQNLFRGARLVYVPGSGEPDSHAAPSAWRYNVAMKYWRPGAEYIFRAYYPQRLHGYTVSTSTAKTFALVYPSRKLQFDLLLGAAAVDTNAKDWDGSKAVPLQLHHALSALRFRFRLKFEDADFLTSVYLLNDEEAHFFSQGTVSYGSETDVESIKWLNSYNPPADEVLYKWVPPLKYWYGANKDTNKDGTPDSVEDKDNDGIIEKEELTELSAEQMLAMWGYVNGQILDSGGTAGKAKDNPVLMISQRTPDVTSSQPGTQTTRASGEASPSPEGANGVEYTQHSNAYYGMEYYYDWKNRKDWVYAPVSERAQEGILYCRNSGWLLIPPQESFGKLTLCFTSKKGGNTVYKVNLPTETGTRFDPETGKEVMENDPNFDKAHHAWVAGKRYTYTVTLSQSDLVVTLSIEPWNERKHSTEIIF